MMAPGCTIHIGTVGGGLSSTPDRGDTWQKLRKEFGDIHSVMVTPN
jgi:hypothetical protein